MFIFEGPFNHFTFAGFFHVSGFLHSLTEGDAKSTMAPRTQRWREMSRPGCGELKTNEVLRWAWGTSISVKHQASRKVLEKCMCFFLVKRQRWISNWRICYRLQRLPAFEWFDFTRKQRSKTIWDMSDVEQHQQKGEFMMFMGKYFDSNIQKIQKISKVAPAFSLIYIHHHGYVYVFFPSQEKEKEGEKASFAVFVIVRRETGQIERYSLHLFLLLLLLSQKLHTLIECFGLWAGKQARCWRVSGD